MRGINLNDSTVIIQTGNDNGPIDADRLSQKGDLDCDSFSPRTKLNEHEWHGLHERKERVEQAGHRLHEFNEGVRRRFGDDPSNIPPRVERQYKLLTKALEKAKGEYDVYKGRLEEKGLNVPG